MPTAQTVQIVGEVRDTLAGKALTERQAKLYSQRLRRQMGQPGLVSFSSADVPHHLDEALFLLHCALIEREADQSSQWRDGLKRSAEILEWLSEADLRPAGTPMHLLAAAAYQLAGYPAMALAHLRRMPEGEQFSLILRDFLQNDFPSALKHVTDFWKEQYDYTIDNPGAIAELDVQTVRHSVMCLGTVLHYLRTGESTKINRALDKLNKLAACFLNSGNTFSFLLARLTAGISQHYIQTCSWHQISNLRQKSTLDAEDAFVQFAKIGFTNRRSLIWPAQKVGITRLVEGNSFVLCTPTGSGKTTVATLAIIQGLFSNTNNLNSEFMIAPQGNLVLYLVPSRALAAEIEGRLAQDLRGIAPSPIVVTGLYGGVDWGPTDAWIETDRPAIVICTFEKADALLRYLGVLFLNRVKLVVIDEVHMVEQDIGRLEGLKDSSSRSFRLEQLGTRLFTARDKYNFRVIALSAVAARAAPALARWVAEGPSAVPTTSEHRSTRQMLGRLEVGQNGQFIIRYDLMDGSSLKFNDERPGETPYVTNPFPRLPGGIDPNAGPEKSMRAPTIWAALHLAAERSDGTRPSVLISLTQNIEVFAENCVEHIESWASQKLPNYRAIDESDDRWIRCLACAADYFTEDSTEYRLLKQGIAVHHGKMPALLARRLKVVIDAGFVRVIIATSTLSEGVNIPVNYLLIPSVCRGEQPLTLQEFTNLIGRAGRPGVASEGHALIVLPERPVLRGRGGTRYVKNSRQWDGYQSLIAMLESATNAADKGEPEDSGSSALGHLLLALEGAWKTLFPNGTPTDFERWLESTSVANGENADSTALSYLDSLDAFLIAALQELEELTGSEVPPASIEKVLVDIWQRTYAFASAQHEDHLRNIWLQRGKGIKKHYPDARQRRQIYRTSLLPRSALILVERSETIRQILERGAAYANFNSEQRFEFVHAVLLELSEIPSFQISKRLGRRKDFSDWPQLLRWWVARLTVSKQPKPKEITSWFEFVAQNFIYRGTWGLGSVLSLLLDLNTEDGPIRALEIDDWPRSGLPWIAFWLKELLTWGTLDPVVAFLLARGNAVDRLDAEQNAQNYYSSLSTDTDPNEILNPRKIRDWLFTTQVIAQTTLPRSDITLSAKLMRDIDSYQSDSISVMPFDTSNTLVWIDQAGYDVAQSHRPPDWLQVPLSYEFTLDVRNETIVGTPYLPFG